MGCRFPAGHFRGAASSWKHFRGIPCETGTALARETHETSFQGCRTAPWSPNKQTNLGLFCSAAQLQERQHWQAWQEQKGLGAGGARPPSQHSLAAVTKLPRLPEPALRSQPRQSNGRDQTWKRTRVTRSNHINEETTLKNSNKACPWQECTEHGTAQSRQEQQPHLMSLQGDTPAPWAEPARASPCWDEPCPLLRPFRTTRSTLVKVQMGSALRRRKISYTNQLQPDLGRNKNMEKNKGKSVKGYNILCHWLYFLIFVLFSWHITEILL